VHSSAAQLLGLHALPGGALHEVRSAQTHEAGFLHHQDHIGERGQISTPCDARPHYSSDLRHLQITAHERVVEEQAARAVLAGENPALVRQVHAGGIDEVNDGNAGAHRDFLRAQHLRDGFRPP
jgi:hypothetical protein